MNVLHLVKNAMAQIIITVHNVIIKEMVIF